MFFLLSSKLQVSSASMWWHARLIFFPSSTSSCTTSVPSPTDSASRSARSVFPTTKRSCRKRRLREEQGKQSEISELPDCLPPVKRSTTDAFTPAPFWDRDGWMSSESVNNWIYVTSKMQDLLPSLPQGFLIFCVWFKKLTVVFC